MTNTEKVTHDDIDELIASTMRRPGLTSKDVLRLTIARRLNNASDDTFAQALGTGTAAASALKKQRRL